MNFKSKKELIKFILTLIVCLIVFILSISGIAYFSNKSHKSNNDLGNNNVNIQLRKNKIATDTDSVLVTALTDTDKDYTFEWTLDWNDISEYNIVNFITYEISEDTKSCTITKLQNFTTQAVLTCNIKDTNIKSTCTIDCISRQFSAKTIVFNSSVKDLTFGEFKSMVHTSVTSSVLSSGTISPTIKLTGCKSFNLNQTNQAVSYFLNQVNDDRLFIDVINEIYNFENENQSLESIKALNSSATSITLNYELIFNDEIISSGYCTVYVQFDIPLTDYS